MKTFSNLIKIIGGTLIVVAIAGVILGSFDYVIEIRGNALPKIDWPTAMALLVIGALFYGIGYLLTKKHGDVNEPAPTAQLDLSDLGFITRSLKKTRRRNLIMGIFMTLFGLAVILLPLFSDESTGLKIGLGIFGGICLALGLFGLYQVSKLANIGTSEIYRLIMHNPGSITALDVLVINSGYGKLGQAINATVIVDKKNKGVLSVNETELELLSQYLFKYNPSLVFNHKQQQVS